MINLLKNIFKRDEDNSSDLPINPILTDIHSHLIPYLDDGSKSMEESISMIKDLADLGYKKLITTPHIINDIYKNSPQSISTGLSELKHELENQNIPVNIEFAAEYFMDENFIKKIDKESLLTFGKEKYILVETSFSNPPVNLQSIFKELKISGYKVVYAHPERYMYMYNDIRNYFRLKEDGILIQININSISGHYSVSPMKMVRKLIDNKLVDFAGTDLHSLNGINVILKSRKDIYYQKLLNLPLKNNEL